MKDFFIRSISGLVYATVVIISCLAGIYGQFFLVVLFTTLSMVEWMQLREEKKIGFTAFLLSGIIFLLIYSHSGIYKTEDYQLDFLKALVFLLIMALFISQAFSYKDNTDLLRLFHASFALIYIGLPLFLLLLVPDFNGERIDWILLSIFIFIWSGDVFAYLSGRFFGKYRFFGRISPNKTWEGFIVGLAFTLAAAVLMSYNLDYLSVEGWLGLGSIVFLFSTLGDLFESAIKRHFKVKDSGKFMPGHGGILDRIDSLLFALPAAYFYLHILENLNT